MLLPIFAAEEVVTASSAASTANTSLAISICTIVVVPLFTLLITKIAEGKKQQQDINATLAKAKLDTDNDATLAKAKIESEAMIAKAKLELDSKLLVLSSQHAECMENHADVERKLEECNKQHADNHEKQVEMQGRLEKCEMFIQTLNPPDKKETVESVQIKSSTSKIVYGGSNPGGRNQA